MCFFFVDVVKKSKGFLLASIADGHLLSECKVNQGDELLCHSSMIGRLDRKTVR